MDNSNIHSDIQNAMTDPKIAALGHRGIYNKLKHKYKKQQLLAEIKNIDSHQIHHKKPKKVLKKQFTPFRVSNIGYLQIDFAEVPKKWTGNVNAKCKYLFCVCDIFSRYLWVVCLPSRNATLYTNAFAKLIEKMKKEHNFTPFAVVSDNEFISNEFKSLLKKHNIRIDYALPEPTHTKTSIIERMIGSLKLMINRYLTHNKSRQFVHVLPKIVDAYNEARHSALGVSPKYAISHKWIFPPKRMRKLKIDNNLQKGEIVRTQTPYSVFQKGHKPRWSKSLYTIVAKIHNRYKISNNETGKIVLNNSNQPKLFPRHQLLLINESKLISKKEKSPSISPASPKAQSHSFEPRRQPMKSRRHYREEAPKHIRKRKKRLRDVLPY